MTERQTAVLELLKRKGELLQGAALESLANKIIEACDADYDDDDDEGEGEE